jgi:hypothetical protein
LVGPDPRRLCTNAGRELLAWAHARAVEWHEPVEVLASELLHSNPKISGMVREGSGRGELP